MNKSELVSVLVPSYNHARYISATLSSIGEQIYPYIQLIVIDDGSKDASVEIIRGFFESHKNRFTHPIFISRPNKGLTHTLNEGLSHADGDYICLLASDDVINPDAISVLFDALQTDSQLALAIGDASFIDAQGKPTLRKTGQREYSYFVDFFTRNRKFYDDGFSIERDFGSYASLLAGNYIPIAPLIRKSVYADIGNYDTHLVYEDYDLWLRIARHYSMTFINRPLAHYRIHDTNTNILSRDAISSNRINIHIREKHYSLQHGHIEAWSLKLVELLLSLAVRRRWADFKKLAEHAEWRFLLLGGRQFVKIQTRKLLE